MDKDNIKEKLSMYIDQHQDEIVDFAKKLISIPSVSGADDSAEQYHKESKYICDQFRTIGIEASGYSNPKSTSGPNTIAVLKGEEPGKVLGIGGHYDVVTADEPDWTIESGFSPVVKDGILIGRGSADMKGGLASCYMAMKALKECNVPLKGDLQFVATIDEEIGGPDGMTYLVNSGTFLPDFFINAEQTEMNITVAFKGCFWAEAEVRGKSAHGSKPWLGINAIEKAVDLIQAWRKKGLKFKHDEFLGDCTINYGVIQGGQLANVVPDKVKIVLDVRLVPGQTYDGALEEFRDVIKEMKEEDPDFDASIEFCSRCTNAVVIDPDSSLVRSLKSNLSQLQGREPELTSFISAGDNCLFHQRDIPALMCGPGSLDCIHKANEWVSIQDLVNSAKLYAMTALDLLS